MDRLVATGVTLYPIISWTETPTGHRKIISYVQFSYLVTPVDHDRFSKTIVNISPLTTVLCPLLKTSTGPTDHCFGSVWLETGQSIVRVLGLDTKKIRSVTIPGVFIVRKFEYC